MTKASALVAAVVVGLVAASPASAREPVISSKFLLERITDPVKALEPLPAGAKTVLVSSHDRNGGNVDGGSTVGIPAITQSVPPSIVSHDSKGFVLMDFKQPGCLLRVFMGGAVPLGGAQQFGRIQVLIDGQKQAIVDEPAAGLFAGNSSSYPAPLVGDYLAQSGGNSSYVPVCFRRSMTFRTTSLPPDPVGYWQANVLLLPQGSAVKPFSPREELGAAARDLRTTGSQPSGAPDFKAEAELKAGGKLGVGSLNGPGVIHHLGFTVEPFDSVTLRRLSLRVRTDGGSKAEIDVPLGAMFGDGIETRPITSKAFGMNPADHTGYLALPIPFRRGATIEVVSNTDATVRVEGWTGPGVPERVSLYGEHHREVPAEASDTRVLDARGSGWLASLVTDDVDGGPISSSPPLQRFLEGDERIHVDGARSPTFYGTGHEEINNGGFYYIYGKYTGRLSGAGPLGRGEGTAGTQSQYRVFTDDAPRWGRRIAFGLEHGGGDEQPQVVELTTFSYRGPRELDETDDLQPGSRGSARKHDLKGDTEQDTLTAYFEGENDGNGTTSTVVAGGFFYLAPDPADSAQAFTSKGIRFDGPLRFRVDLDKRAADGAVLRGLFDQGPPLTSLGVEVDGRNAGTWASPTAIPNPSKRWLEDDFALPARMTKGRRSIEVTLRPEAGGQGNLFGLTALARRQR